MSEAVHFEDKKTKCPLGFSSWWGKKPDYVKNTQTNSVKLDDDIKTTIQCQNKPFYS